MLRRWLLFFLLPTAGLRAQPGGGGGIGFQQLYGQEGHALVPLSWEAARARVFSFQEEEYGVHDRAAIRQEIYSPRFEHLGLQPQRLLFIHRGDTMVLDLDHLMPPNGGGYWHQLDSLVVMPGYFRYADTVGIGSFTPHAVALLRAHHQVTYRPRARLDFLTPTRLGADYYLALSQQWLRQHRPDSALAALHAAETRQPRLQHALTTAAGRAIAYQQLGDYPAAVRWATQALGPAKQNYRVAERDQAWQPYEELTCLYRQRQHLYLLEHNDRAALADFDTLAALFARRNPGYLRANPSQPAIDRAFFLADSLHRPAAYGEAARLLRQLLPTKPAPEWPCDRRYRLNAYNYAPPSANTYFRLGLAEYRDGHYPAAFQHWRQALAEGQAFRHGDAYVAHFDSVLARWPGQPLLYLGRAIAHLSYYEVPHSPGRTVAVDGDYAAALRDLDQAEQLGYTHVDLRYYRALALKGLKRWANMRQQLDRAIGQVPQAGELYLLRYEARAGLKETTTSGPPDPDLAAYHRLCPLAR